MNNYHIYGLGSALVDMELRVEDNFLRRLKLSKGRMTLMNAAQYERLEETVARHLHRARRQGGGSAANTVTAAGYFGGRCYLCCTVAEDENGRFYRRELSRAGVQHKLGELPAGVTGKCLVLVTPDGERTLNTCLGISEQLAPRHVDKKALLRAQYLYLEGYLSTGESICAAALEALWLARAAGVKTALSFSDPGVVMNCRAALQEMLGEQGVDLLFCNAAEALAWSGADTLEEACSALSEIARSFAITRGGDGALLWDGSRRIEVAPYPARVVDTNGAGDMFAGALLFGLSHGYSWQEAGRLASHAAGRLVEHFGPRLEPEQHQQILAQATDPATSEKAGTG